MEKGTASVQSIVINYSGVKAASYWMDLVCWNLDAYIKGTPNNVSYEEKENLYFTLRLSPHLMNSTLISEIVKAADLCSK